YKFTNGAWSDIILGAVMGAARRAERNEAGWRANDESATSSPSTPQTPSPETKGGAPNVSHPDAESGDRDEATPVSKFDRHIRAARPNIAIDPEHAARFGPYANVYRPEPEFTPPQAPRVRRAPAKPEPEADVTVKAANSNTIDATPIVPAPPPLP